MSASRRITSATTTEEQPHASLLPLDTILCGDALQVLQTLPSESVQTCISSPPYWGLRDYGTAQWVGGDSVCSHKPEVAPISARPRSGLTGSLHYMQAQEPHFHTACGKCGAVRQDAQLGLEATPEEYVAKLVTIFREVRRVLRNDGTLWLNLGDSYFRDSSTRTKSSESFSETWDKSQTRSRGGQRRSAARMGALKPKDLCMIPARAALALQADGWWLRSDCVWAKPNPMPESVMDRPTKSHEYLFLLSKSARYYYDATAILEPVKQASLDRALYAPSSYALNIHNIKGRRPADGTQTNPAGRNKRSVWTISTKPFAGAHFAVMPEAMVEPCVLAGTSPKACEHCGAPWVRVVEKPFRGDGNPYSYEERAKVGNKMRLSGKMLAAEHAARPVKHIGYRPTCRCAVNTGAARGVVLDPFMGAGTVAVVTRRHSRHYLGIELNPAYVEMAERRIQAAQSPQKPKRPTVVRQRAASASKVARPSLWEGVGA